nr:MAG TPA: hypothetical protein [Caudoviricetes sp.]
MFLIAIGLNMILILRKEEVTVILLHFNLK